MEDKVECIECYGKGVINTGAFYHIRKKCSYCKGTGLMKKKRHWICETTCIATMTGLIEANSREEAMEILKSGNDSKIECTHVEYGNKRAKRLYGEDK